MATNYPGGLDSFTPKTDNMDIVEAAHINDLQDAVAAVQAELGTDPAGSAATVKARLDGVDTSVLARVEIVQNLTKTVGSGKDFATIQAAVDFFKGKALAGENRIEVDPGNYAENLAIEDFYSVKIDNLKLIGDTRALVGVRYAASGAISIPIQPEVTNGGSGNCGLSNSGSTITVTGSGGNPSFSAGGITAGDKVIVGNNSGVQSEMTVSSVSGNVITFTSSAPAVGSQGSFLVILPNRRITSPAQITALRTVAIVGVKIRLIGFTIYTPTTNQNWCVACVNGSYVAIENLVALGGGIGYIANGSSSLSGVLVDCDFDSTLSNRIGISGWNGSILSIRTSSSFQRSGVGAIGFSAERGCSAFDCRNSLAVRCATAYRAWWGSTYMDVVSCIAIAATLGYHADALSLILATTTNALADATTKYSPATSDTPGNGGSVIRWS